VRQGVKVGTINCAWFICFAPIEDPQIAVAVMIEGEKMGEAFGGGLHSTPVAQAIIKKYLEKKAETPAMPALTLK
jgi:penicillin-binding protein 2